MKSGAIAMTGVTGLASIVLALCSWAVDDAQAQAAEPIPESASAAESPLENLTEKADAAAAKHAGFDPFTKNCAPCHSVGDGMRTGPDLKGLLDRIPSREWALNFIKDPISANDAYASKLKEEIPGVMSPMGHLGDTTLNDILDFIEAGGPGLVYKKLRRIEPSDIALGEQLFKGEVRLHNGGPACISCHTVSGLGPWGGGTLATDLTEAVERNGGQKGLSTALLNPQFIVMKDVFADKGLTEDEVLAITGYLGSVAGEPEESASDFWFVLICLLGAFNAILLANAVWSRRFTRVRKDLIEKVYSGEKA